VQAYGSSRVDASLLTIPVLGFLPIDDPRVQVTIAAVEEDLQQDGLVRRYLTDGRQATSVDGLPPGEGAFLACSFWLVDAYVLSGRLDEATALFDRLLALGNDLGLFAEEYDPVGDHQLGNFPQAFTHVAAVQSALLLSRANATPKTVHGFSNHPIQEIAAA
jgi:GH15 family glucan-1,4-alpha-glucosidase